MTGISFKKKLIKGFERKLEGQQKEQFFGKVVKVKIPNILLRRK